MSFPKLVNMAKNTPFFNNFARFCTPKRCTRVHCLILKNNPNYVIFLRGWYPTSNTSAPPPGFHWDRSLTVGVGGVAGHRYRLDIGPLHGHKGHNVHSCPHDRLTTTHAHARSGISNVGLYCVWGAGADTGWMCQSLDQSINPLIGEQSVNRLMK